MRGDKTIVPNNETLKYYFYFIQERMEMFWRKIEGNRCYTKDEILRCHKFTNVYRATDRVSQYLIKEVIYKDIELYKPKDVLLRVLVFKVFNKIETWEYLKQMLPYPLTVQTFDPHLISVLLTDRQKHFPIFNNAYMMTGSHKKYDYLPTKHEKWLTMLKKEIVDGGLLEEILKAKHMEDVYDCLKSCSFIGEFLAYQYTIDLNYSPFLGFSENEFVKAGIGAIRGIKKCFINYGECYEDAIFYVKNHFHELQAMYGFNSFRELPGHSPTLIDLQNCFCETDKYLRAKMPELIVGNVRIKQTYKPVNRSIEFYFPPKWKIKGSFKYNPIINQSLLDLWN